MAVFKYLPRQTGGAVVFAPMLDVMLRHDRQIHSRAYVDSGASTTYVPRMAADRAGLLDHGPGTEADAVGISGSVTVSEHRIKSIAIIRNGKIFDLFDGPRILVP